MDSASHRGAYAQSSGIKVRAVYPTFAIISWDKPHYRGGDELPLTDCVTWRYTVEWTCACLQRHTPFSSGAPSPFAFAVLPISHPGETFYVRVISRGTLGGATVGLTSAKCSFVAKCDVRFPWLQPSSLASPLLYHCLSLAANSGSPEAVLSGPVTYVREGARLLESGLVVSLFQLSYAAGSPSPVSGVRYVLCAVAEGRGPSVAAARGATPLSHAALWARVEIEAAAVILCGIGELGATAALATYAMIAGLREAGQSEGALQPRVWCAAFGTPRRTLLQDPAVLLPAARLSSNVLFYSSLMVPSSLEGGGTDLFPHVMFAGGIPSRTAGTATGELLPSLLGSPGGVPHTDAAVDVPLGVRVGPVVDSTTCRLFLYGEAATVALPSDEERFECLDTTDHLALLEGLFIRCPGRAHHAHNRNSRIAAGDRDGSTDVSTEEDTEEVSGSSSDESKGSELSPAITAISHEVDDSGSLLLRVYIGGRNLHYSPRVTCLTHPGDEPLAMTIVSRSPRQIVCHASLAVNLCAACFAAVAVGSPAPSHLAVSLLVHTDMGVTTHSAAPWVLLQARRSQHQSPSPCLAGSGTPSGEATAGGPIVPVPRFITELLHKACQRVFAADSWLVDSPIRLVDAVLSFLPYAIFDSTGRDPRVVDRHITGSRGTRHLGHLATAAEVANHYRARKPLNGLRAFVEKVAAKISSQSESGAGGIALHMPPLLEATYLQGALKDLSLSSAMPISAYLARMISWKKRIFAGLPSLDENRYKRKLQWLLTVLEENDMGREQPLVSLELQIYSRVVRHLRSTHREITMPVVRGNTRHTTNAATSAEDSLSHVRRTVASPESSSWLAGDFVVTDSFSFPEFFDLTYPLFLHTLTTTTSEDAETAVVLEVCFLWAVCVLLQLRRGHTSSYQHHVAVTGCRGSGVSTVAGALTSIGAELRSAGSGVPPIAVKQVPEYGLVLLREMMSLGVAVTVIITAELPDFGSLAFTAISRSIRASVTNPKRQHVHVVLAKVDERLSPLAAESGAEPPERQVAVLVQAATVAATAAAAQNSKGGQQPVAVSLAPSLVSVRAALQSVQSRVSEDAFAVELLKQSVTKLRSLVLADVEAT